MQRSDTYGYDGRVLKIASFAVGLLVAVVAWAETPMAQAKEAVEAIRTVYNVASVTSEQPQWTESTCFRKVTGYVKVLACAERVAAAERARAAKLQPRSSTGACAREIDGAVRAMLRGRVAEVDAWVQRLKQHGAELTKTLASRSIADACSGAKLFDAKHTPACDARPSADFGATIASVNDVACTKALFRCGLDPDNVCWIQKAADRVKTKPRVPDDYLYVRETGERVALP
jgi:hypothetical protein